jgi:hypothetical protein
MEKPPLHGNAPVYRQLYSGQKRADYIQYSCEKWLNKEDKEEVNHVRKYQSA